jgi:hypothetical protein
MLIWFPDNLGVMEREDGLLRKEVFFCQLTKNHMKNMAAGLWCRIKNGCLIRQFGTKITFLGPTL